MLDTAASFSPSLRAPGAAIFRPWVMDVCSCFQASEPPLNECHAPLERRLSARLPLVFSPYVFRHALASEPICQLATGIPLYKVVYHPTELAYHFLRCRLASVDVPTAAVL